jgi:hypothetical protein
MMAAVVVALAALCAWLGVKLSAVSKDNADLRTRVESMRRQLQRLR